MLDGHVRGLRLALQDLDRHLAGLVAQLLVVDAVGGQAAVVDHALLPADDGELVLVRDHRDRGHARRDGVVGGGVAGVDLSYHGLHDLLDLVGARDRVAGCREVALLGGLLGHLHLDVRVALCGAVQDADGLGVGEQLHQQAELVVDWRQVRGAGDVVAGLVVAVHQAGRGEVGDRRPHDGDVGRGARDGLRGGGRDGKDQVVLSLIKSGIKVPMSSSSSLDKV